MLGYSREQEAQADEDALNAVVALYGHAGGMIELFTRLGEAKAGAGPHVEVLRTHPLTQARLAAVQAQARRAGWATTGTLTPLPAALVLPAERR